MIVKPLKWDSEFFGYPVGTLEINSDNWSEKELVAASQNFRLVYVKSRDSLNTSILKHGDTKLIFGKKPETLELPHTVVEASEEHLEKLQKIGLQSGIWSRFALDPNFQNNEFERMYNTWVNKSLSKEIAYSVLTVLEDCNPGGIITLAQSAPDTSSIGLFAVDESFRGKGIGTTLLKTADAMSAKRGDAQLHVATQGKNTVACEVYKRFGFELISETYIYNHWNEAFTLQ